jgi:hypothetical protein
MNEVYNLRIGDMLYHSQAFNRDGEREDSAIMAVIYKVTPKYVYYAVCARSLDNAGDHFITRDNRTAKRNIYNSIHQGKIHISYSNGIKRRKKIEDFS